LGLKDRIDDFAALGLQDWASMTWAETVGSQVTRVELVHSNRRAKLPRNLRKYLLCIRL
jgi:hypothetical protein